MARANSYFPTLDPKAAAVSLAHADFSECLERPRTKDGKIDKSVLPSWYGNGGYLRGKHNRCGFLRFLPLREP